MLPLSHHACPQAVEVLEIDAGVTGAAPGGPSLDARLLTALTSSKARGRAAVVLIDHADDIAAFESHAAPAVLDAARTIALQAHAPSFSVYFVLGHHTPTVHRALAGVCDHIVGVALPDDVARSAAVCHHASAHRLPPPSPSALDAVVRATRGFTLAQLARCVRLCGLLGADGSWDAFPDAAQLVRSARVFVNIGRVRENERERVCGCLCARE